MKDAKKDAIDMQELERQLSHPTGQTGIEVANMLNETNIGMTLSTIELLDLKDNNVVLELGHGNCSHLAKLLSKAHNIHYHGLEVSETMFQEAKRINKDLEAGHAISFQLYDGEKIPFPDAMFDRIMTVNTLYFWSSPKKFINEIGRTLKPGGHCVITYVQKAFMEKLPFVGEIFHLYDDNDIRDLASTSALQLAQIVPKSEYVKTKDGQSVERMYSMAVLRAV